MRGFNMNVIKKIMHAIEKTNLFMGKLMVIILLLAVFVITMEVTMRFVFNLPTNWGHELMTILFAILYVFSAGYCHYHRAHVRVDILYINCTKRVRAWMDIFTSIFAYIFLVVFFWTSVNFYWSSQLMQAGDVFFWIHLIGERSPTDWAPSYYPVKFMMVAGGLMLVLQQLCWSVRDVYIAYTGRELK